MKPQKGFTIIELIVVIAIIAVLAAIVLVNVTSYIAKGKDASIKGNLSSMATIAAAHYDSYSTFIDDALTLTVDEDLADSATFKAGLTAIENAAPNKAVPTKKITASAWCVESALNTTADGPWCADSSGFKGKIATDDCSGGTAATCATGD